MTVPHGTQAAGAVRPVPSERRPCILLVEDDDVVARIVVDHGPDGTGEPLQIHLRPGNAGSNTAAHHITITRKSLRQLPFHRPGTRPGRKVLIRVDGAGATHDYLNWLTGQRLSYSVGFGLPTNTADLLTQIPDHVWAPAYDAHDKVRDGAWVAELTDLLNLSGWPKGMRVIARKKRPHPGAQLRITDVDELRVDRFRHQHRHQWTRHPAGRPGTTAPPPRPRRRPDPLLQGHRPARAAAARLRPEPDLVRHRRPRRRAHRLDADARPDPPRRPPVGAQTAPAAAVPVPATLARTSRQVLLHLADKSPRADLVRDGIHRLRALAVPG
jgi:hypothetical protein